MSSKLRKVKFKPRIKLNQNRFMRFGLKMITTLNVYGKNSSQSMINSIVNVKSFNFFLTFTFGGSTSGTWGGVMGRDPLPSKEP